MITAEELVGSIEQVEDKELYKLGTVLSLFPIGTAQVQFDGEDFPSEKEYSYLESYRPKVGDRVLITLASGTYIILGKINYNEAPSSDQISRIDNALYVSNTLSCNSFHHRGNYLSFFNKYQNVGKRSVATISTSAELSTVINKLNEVINDLKAYNLL